MMKTFYFFDMFGNIPICREKKIGQTKKEKKSFIIISEQASILLFQCKNYRVSKIQLFKELRDML